MKIHENPLTNGQNENYLTYIRDYTEKDGFCTLTNKYEVFQEQKSYM